MLKYKYFIIEYNRTEIKNNICPFIAVKANDIDSMLIALTAINGNVLFLFSLRDIYFFSSSQYDSSLINTIIAQFRILKMFHRDFFPIFGDFSKIHFCIWEYV